MFFLEGLEDSRLIMEKMASVRVSSVVYLKTPMGENFSLRISLKISLPWTAITG